MTEQTSKLKALELTVCIIDELHSSVRNKTYELYLLDQKILLSHSIDNIKQDKNCVVPSIVFIQAYSVVKCYQTSIQRMYDIFKEYFQPDYFYRMAVIGVLKEQLCRFANEK